MMDIGTGVVSNIGIVVGLISSLITIFATIISLLRYQSMPKLVVIVAGMSILMHLLVLIMLLTPQRISLPEQLGYEIVITPSRGAVVATFTPTSAPTDIPLPSSTPAPVPTATLADTPTPASLLHKLNGEIVTCLALHYYGNVAYFKDLCLYNGYPNARGDEKWTECSTLSNSTEIEIPYELEVQTGDGKKIVQRLHHKIPKVPFLCHLEMFESTD